MKGVKGFRKGIIPWNKGLTKETDWRVLKYANDRKGKKLPEEQRLKLSRAMLGKHLSEETKERQRLAHLGRKYKPMSETGRRNISIASKGKHKSPRTEFKSGHKQSRETIERRRSKLIGKKRSIETRRRLSEANKGKISKLIKDKHPNWKGGISFEPYSSEWRDTLKRAIRERDNYTCNLCLTNQKEETLHVHHIDYDKKNCNPTNLITLCNSCHIKTNFGREKWTLFFSLLVKERGIR